VIAGRVGHGLGLEKLGISRQRGGVAGPSPKASIDLPVSQCLPPERGRVRMGEEPADHPPPGSSPARGEELMSPANVYANENRYGPSGRRWRCTSRPRLVWRRKGPVWRRRQPRTNCVSESWLHSGLPPIHPLPRQRCRTAGDGAREDMEVDMPSITGVNAVSQRWRVIIVGGGLGGLRGRPGAEISAHRGDAH
jgi:hypothetical protein